MATRITVDTTRYGTAYGHNPRPTMLGCWAFAIDAPRYHVAEHDSVEPFMFTGSYREALKHAKAQATHSVKVLP